MGKRKIEAVYPLSPMQQGMLFHSIYDPSCGVYFEQLTCSLQGDLNLEAFHQAWQYITNRHATLRTAFVWKKQNKMLQVVHCSIDLPIQQLDWSDLTSEEQQNQLNAFLEEDRLLSFDLSQAPLMRLALIRTSPLSFFFVWTHHHLLLDGWSNAILLKEVFSSYQAFSSNRSPSLPAVRPFRDYIAWLQAQDPAHALSFWSSYLAGFSAPTPLSIDRSLPLSGYDEALVHLSSSATANLVAAARLNHVSLSTLLQAAWAILLSRYSSQSDVLFGLTVSGRPPSLDGVDNMVGLFINSLPIRVQVLPDLTLSAFLSSLQSLQAQLHQFEFSPLVDIQGCSDVPRSLPLFYSLLVFENFPLDVDQLLSSPSLHVQQLLSVEQTNFPLTLISGPGDELLLKASFDLSRFSRSSILRLLSHLATLLQAMPTCLSLPLSSLPILPDAERLTLLTDWNQTDSPYPDHACIQHLFEQQVDLHPEAPALFFHDRSLSYLQLDLLANRIAHLLLAHPFPPESLAAICLPRSPNMIASLLAVLKAGGAYLPLDPALPEDRLAFILQDAQPSFLITLSHIAARFPNFHGSLLCLDCDQNLLDLLPASRPDPALSPDQLAYVIYTSGSSGSPKGTLLEHRGLVNFISAFRKDTKVNENSRVLQFYSLGFDASVLEIFMTLTSGAALYLARPEQLLSLNELKEFIIHHQLTTLFLPPALLNILPDGDLLPVQTVISGGEVLPLPTASRWSKGRTLINAYGPTETTIAATRYVVKENPEETESIPIGTPFANTKVYVVDENLQPVPIGVPGELLIGGLGLARGYLNRPDLSALKFIPNPFAPGRLYRSGDRVRFREDGLLEFLGRLDSQVKIRGFRVELGEIESLLSSHPLILQAAVLPCGVPPADLFLAAYLVPSSPSSPPSPSDLRDFLRLRLPDYMLPSAFLFLPALPLSPSGKLDRKALPPPSPSSDFLHAPFTAPRSHLEHALADLWALILPSPRFGIFDNFFDLGGHSLLATQLDALIRQSFQVDLPLRDLFEFPTIAAQADRLALALQSGAGLSSPPISPASRDLPLPLSFSQQRLWFLDQLAPGNLFYNLPLLVRLQGALSLPALNQAFSALLSRHESLRTSFYDRSGQPFQRIQDPPAFSLAPIQACTRSFEEVLALAAQQALLPFDLSRGPLLRAVLFQLAPDDFILALTIHHIVADEWSMGVLVRELAALYQAFAAGLPNPLPPLPIQYADFAVWQRSWLQGTVLDSLLDFWKHLLADRPLLLDLPFDHPRPPVQSWNGSSFPFLIPPPLAARLRSLARSQDATLFMALLSAFFALLFRYSHQDFINVGTAVANRSLPETQNLIGFFVNMLALPLDLSGQPSFSVLLSRVREVCLAAFAHQDLPFESLVEALQPQRDLSHSPIFQVAFSFQTPPASLDLPDLSLSLFDAPSSSAKYDLTLYISDSPEALPASLEFNSDLFDPDSIQRMADHFLTLLSAALDDPDLPISSLPLLPPAERQLLLVDWNAAAQAPLRGGLCGHSLFELQADAVPSAPALRFQGDSLSYAELDARSNRLAHFLLAQGVVPEQPVGLSFSRSFEMVIAFLAVLKAGGAVLPLDPAYPADRLAFMLHDSHAPLLLSQHALAPLFPSFSGKLFCFDDLPLSDFPASRPAVPLSSDQLAYIIYTSGSTGFPKGVLVQHSGLENLAAAQRRAFSLSSSSRILQFSPLSFDASVWEIFMALANGAALILAPQQVLASPPDLLQLLRAEAVSHMTLPPSLLRLLPPDPLPDLRVLVAAGEACPADLVQRWAPGRAFFNAYGPTEATVCASMFRCDPSSSAPPPIGRPLDNVLLFVLDANLQPVPIGVPGELFIGGPGLARGYLNRPDLSALKFIPNPFAPGSLYRSGDLVRYLPDGNLLFLGRIDTQVKVRGFRIELGEIESVLLLHPAISKAVLAAYEFQPGDLRLAAYILPISDPPSVEDLRSFLHARLPEYMLPSAFIFLDSLPLSPSGKVDRAALPHPLGLRPDLLHPYLAPRSETEALLADISAQLLGLDRVGVLDNFFALGGHSLLATQFVSRIRSTFHIDLPLRSLFEFPSIADLALQVELLQNSAPTEEEIIVPISRDAHRVSRSKISIEDD